MRNPTVADLRINTAEFNAIARAAAIKEIRAGARQTTNRAKVLAPVLNGFLQASIKPTERISGSVLRIDVGAHTDYALAIHEGRPAVDIKPKKGMFLKFEINGRTVFAREVHQVARPGRPYLSRALREVAQSRGWRFVNYGHL